MDITSLLERVGYEYVILAVALIVILIVLKILKKITKAAITVLIILILVTSGGGIMEYVKSKADIRVENNVLYIDTEYTPEFSLELDNVKEVIISKTKGSDTAKVRVVTNKKESKLEVPSKLSNILESILKASNVKVVIEE